MLQLFTCVIIDASTLKWTSSFRSLMLAVFFAKRRISCLEMAQIYCSHSAYIQQTAHETILQIFFNWKWRKKVQLEWKKAFKRSERLCWVVLTKWPELSRADGWTGASLAYRNKTALLCFACFAFVFIIYNLVFNAILLWKSSYGYHQGKGWNCLLLEPGITLNRIVCTWTGVLQKTAIVIRLLLAKGEKAWARPGEQFNIIKIGRTVY